MFQNNSGDEKDAQQKSAGHVLSPEMQEDQQLMQKAAAGDQKAFAKLYNKYKGPIMSYVSTMIRGQSSVQELTQEIFLKAFRARESYIPTAKFSTWLWTIAKNTCFDYLRSAQRREVLVADKVSEDSDVLTIEDMSSDELSVETKLIEEKDRERVADCLQKIPPSQREVLVLRTVSELSYEEIVTATRQSMSSVKSLIFRAKQSLVECLQKGER